MGKPKRFKCEHCHKPFLSPYKKKFCSPGCLRKGRKKPEETLNVFIINKFLKNPEAVWKDPIAAPREVVFTKRLIEKYPLEIFWRSLPPKFSTETLAWYTSKQGWAYLKLEYAKFSLDLRPRKLHNVSDTKFGDDRIILQKTTTIEDFLKYGSQKENK